MTTIEKTSDPKFIRKWMLLAKTIAEQNDACYSRQIGTVIVDPKTNSVVSVGYNGPPQNTPHCDSYEFLRNFFWPQLTLKEKLILLDSLPDQHIHAAFVSNNRIQAENEQRDSWCSHYKECKICPRRLINTDIGQRTELCSCTHSEANALNKLPISSVGLVVYIWPIQPCIQCAGALINAGIDKVFCLKDQDYHPVSRFLFDQSCCELIECKEEDIIGGAGDG